MTWNEINDTRGEFCRFQQGTTLTYPELMGNMLPSNTLVKPNGGQHFIWGITYRSNVRQMLIRSGTWWSCDDGILLGKKETRKIVKQIQTYREAKFKELWKVMHNYRRRHKARIWLTQGCKIGSENKNFAIKYFEPSNIKQAIEFNKDTLIQKRDLSAERYERRRQEYLNDPEQVNVIEFFRRQNDAHV